jgi:hypothetical protein
MLISAYVKVESSQRREAEKGGFGEVVGEVGAR